MSTATLQPSIIGEDVPLVITYENDSQVATDPDNVDADTGATPDAYITIRKEDAATPIVDRAPMNHLSTGTFEYVWDTSVNVDGTGRYQADAEATFSGETKISRVTVPLR